MPISAFLGMGLGNFFSFLLGSSAFGTLVHTPETVFLQPPFKTCFLKEPS